MHAEGSTSNANNLGLVWVYSTDDGNNWTCGGQLIFDPNVTYVASAVVDSSDNVYVVYSTYNNSGSLIYDVFYRKITKGIGQTWTLENAQIALDSNNVLTGYSLATIEVEGTSRLWIASRYFDGSNYQVSAHYSSNLSTSPAWTQSQLALSTPSTSTGDHMPVIVRFGSSIGIIYNSYIVNLNQFSQRWRFRSDSDPLTSWSQESIVSNENMDAPIFTAVGSPNGNIYYASFISGGQNYINFSYWNGSVWSNTITLVTTPNANTNFIGLTTDGTNVWVYYPDSTNLNGGLPGSRKLVYKKGVPPFDISSFDANPTSVISYHGFFDKYWSYVSGVYTNDTTDAGSTSASDVQMVSKVDDIAYFGKTTKFDSVNWDVSTSGVGGQIIWEYWNGSAWVSITDFLGINWNAFTNDGYISFIPNNDWTATRVNNDASDYYYVRARTIVAYSTPPVSAQLSTIPPIFYGTVLPYATSDKVYSIWTENSTSPTRTRIVATNVTTATNNSSSAEIAPGFVAYSSTAAATYPSTMKHLVTTSDGTLHAFIQSGNRLPCGGSTSSANAAGLVWIYSTDDGSNWTCGGLLRDVTITTEYASAVVDSSDNIYVVYSTSAGGSNALYNAYYRKLSKGTGKTWTVGAQQTALSAGSGTVGYTFPVIEIEGNTRLWLAVRYFDGTNYQISVYYSDGFSDTPKWTLSQQSLDTPGGSNGDHFPAIVRFGSKIGIAYAAQLPLPNQRWRYRSDSDPLTSWAPEMQVSDEPVDAPTYTLASDQNGNVYQLTADIYNRVSLTYWNGYVWSARNTIAGLSGFAYVGLSTDGYNVWAFYSDAYGVAGGQPGRRFAYKKGIPPYTSSEFDPIATSVLPYQTTFDSYWSFINNAYTNDTVDAASTASGDTQMLANVNDAIYLGKTTKYDSITWDISNTPLGGIVTWEYWNGEGWTSLNDVLGYSYPEFLGDGYISFVPPTNWSTTSINGESTSYYYIRARVNTAYTTAPVGVQFGIFPPAYGGSATSAPINNKIYTLWSENNVAPVRVRSSAVTVSATTSNTASSEELKPLPNSSTFYSSIAGATASSTQRNLVKTSDGTLHAFIQVGANTACKDTNTSANTNGLIHMISTNAGVTWNCADQLIYDPNYFYYASAAVDSSDNVYVVYSVSQGGVNAAFDVFYRKFTKMTGSNWNMEAQQTAIDVNATKGHSYAVIEIDSLNRLWLATRYLDSSNYQVSAYYSNNLSATPEWTLSQTTLSTSNTNSSYYIPLIVKFGTNIGIIYNSQNTSNIRWRYRSDNDPVTSWNTESTVSDRNFAGGTYSAQGDSSGNVYFAVNVSTSIFSNYWNGTAWSSNAIVSNGTAANIAFVSVGLVGNSMYVYYGETTGLSGGLWGSRKLVYKTGTYPYATANFSPSSTSLIPYHSTFEKYWSYVSSVYTNDTTDASNTTNADTQMLSNTGDVIYFGKNLKFDTVSWDVSTLGIGGIVTWEYWNGTTWAILPDYAGVNYPSFTNDGYISFIPPSDWATTQVNSDTSGYYYVRSRVVLPYTTPPIGVQFTSIPTINWASTIGSASNLYYMWTESATMPYKVQFSAYIFNVAPDTPSSLGPSSLVNGNSISNSNPTFQFVLSDANIGEGVKYQIQIDDSADFSSPIVDYTSGLANTGQTSFTVGQDAGSGTYTTGEEEQFLADGNYYWRVKAIDAATLSSEYSTANNGLLAFALDATAPQTNASGITMLRSSGNKPISSGGWTNNEDPYFSWSAGLDNENGSGIKGYCLYLGTDGTGNPETSKGILGTSPVSIDGTKCQFIVSTTSIDFSKATPEYRGTTWLTTSNETYYLNIKAIDQTNNIFSDGSAQFSFKFDDAPPVNVAYINPAAGTYSNVVDMSFSWPSVGASTSYDEFSQVLGWQYQINSTTGTWLGSTTNSELGINYIPTSELSRTFTTEVDGPHVITGTNTIYFRTVDRAGNYSSDTTIRTGSILFGGAAPRFAPTDTVTVTPTKSISNSYGISWPAATPTDGQNVTHYYYMINTLPPSTLNTLQSNSSTYIDNGISRTVPLASLPNVNRGSNVVYVVAIDDANNYSPSTYVSGKFTLNSSAPDNIASLTASDSSIKSENKWMATLSWTAPTYTGAGNLSYLVYRSTDNSSFSQVGTTSGLSYVDSTPESTTYYYKIYTKDGANALSSGTNSVSIFPTGKWLTAPTLDSKPVTSLITTKKATITWATSRAADSKVQFGTKKGDYGDVEPSNSSLSASHTIALTGLNPGTTYYYRAKWTDEDGNTGTSAEYSFATQPAPTVRDVIAKNVGLDSAILSFTSDGATKIKIYYGTSTSFGGLKEISTSYTESIQIAELSGLNDGTKYYYKINTLDIEDEEYEGTILDFTTLPRPKISNVRIQQVKGAVQSSIYVTWNTNTEISSIVTYYPEDKPSETKDEVSAQLLSGEHKMLIRGLLPQTTYILVVKGRDKVGNEAISDTQRLTTATDTRPPQISGLRVEGNNTPPTNSTSQEYYAQFVVTWNTDEPATSQVEFGEGTGTTYSQKTQEDTNLTNNHIVIISNLTAAKVYHLRAISVDKAKNQGASIDTVSITPKQTDNALDLVITNLQQVFGFLGELK